MPFQPMLVHIAINKKSPSVNRGFNMVNEIVFLNYEVLDTLAA